MISFRGGARSAPIAALCGDPIRQGAGRAAPQAETTWRTGRPGKFASRGMRAAQGKFVGQAGCGDEARGVLERSGSAVQARRARARIRANRQGRGSGPPLARNQAHRPRQRGNRLPAWVRHAERQAGRPMSRAASTLRRIHEQREERRLRVEVTRPPARRRTGPHHDHPPPARTEEGMPRTTGRSLTDRKPVPRIAGRLVLFGAASLRACRRVPASS